MATEQEIIDLSLRLASVAEDVVNGMEPASAIEDLIKEVRIAIDPEWYGSYYEED